MSDRFGKVAVLYGGTSSERAVSLDGGAAVHQALAANGVDAHLIDACNRGAVLKLKQNGYARAFIMLHGRGGEDGQIQAILHWLGIPCTGSDMMASAIAMDKVMTKKLWQAYDLPVLPDLLCQRGCRYQDIVQALDARTLAVKPVNDGSSLGISRVTNQVELDAAIAFAAERDDRIMVEPWIHGRELTYAIVGEEILPGIEIVTSKAHPFYDYQAKYFADDIRYLCPAPIDSAFAAEIVALTHRAFQALGAKGWGRVDYILDKNMRPWLLEINLVPGMTVHSLLPQAAAVAGKSFADVVLAVLEQTLSEKDERRDDPENA